MKLITHHVIHTPSPIMLGIRGCAEKNLSSTSTTRDKVTIKYISVRKHSGIERSKPTICCDLTDGMLET